MRMTFLCLVFIRGIISLSIQSRMKKWTPPFCQTQVVVKQMKKRKVRMMKESIWIEELTTKTEVDLNQAVGMAVDPASLNSSKDLFEFFFTDIRYGNC